MKIMGLIGLLLAVTIVSGCAQSRELIKTVGINTRTDIFQQVFIKGNIPQGSADLIIYSSLKTHKPGLYISDDMFGNKKGTPDYVLLVNIDGQATSIKGTLHAENGGSCSLRNSEIGEGIRYIFNRKLRLKEGIHRLIVAIPEDGIAIEKGISLAGGTENVIELIPQYWSSKPIGYSRHTTYTMRKTSFAGGLRTFDILLNEDSL